MHTQKKKINFLWQPSTKIVSELSFNGYLLYGYVLKREFFFKRSKIFF